MAGSPTTDQVRSTTGDLQWLRRQRRRARRRLARSARRRSKRSPCPAAFGQPEVRRLDSCLACKGRSTTNESTARDRRQSVPCLFLQGQSHFQAATRDARCRVGSHPSLLPRAPRSPLDEPRSRSHPYGDACRRCVHLVSPRVGLLAASCSRPTRTSSRSGSRWCALISPPA